MNRLLALSMLLLLCCGNLLAQKVIEKTFPLAKGQKVNLNLKFGENILVKAWDKNEVSFKAIVEINGGKLNDALVVDFTNNAGELRAVADYDKELLKQGKREDCPENGRYSYYNNDRGSGSYICSKINYEIYVPKNVDLTVESINADVELKDLTGPVFAKTINGFVDMNMPANKASDVSLKTINGELYSDLDITFLNKKKTHAPVGYLLKGTINGGGTAVHLETINSDIYLRKANR